MALRAVDHVGEHLRVGVQRRQHRVQACAVQPLERAIGVDAGLRLRHHGHQHASLHAIQQAGQQLGGRVQQQQRTRRERGKQARERGV